MSTYLSAFKSYGDFVIAWSSARRAVASMENPAPVVVAGHHLFELASALRCTDSVRFIGDASWTDVPAAFDVGKKGRLAAMRSVLVLRRCLGNIERGALVFDRLGLRERLIGSAHAPLGLPPSENIYTAYDALLSQLGYSLSSGQNISLNRLQKPQHPQRAVIVPGSRLARKAIPTTTITSIYNCLKGHGFDVNIIVLESESFEISPCLPLKILPRRFADLINALQSADVVLSADSLSAHLGEHLGLPTFVATPTPNEYWLPRSSFMLNGWANFHELKPLDTWLNRISQSALDEHVSTCANSA